MMIDMIASRGVPNGLFFFFKVTVPEGFFFIFFSYSCDEEDIYVLSHFS